jgi:hypothetical protein
MGKNEELRGDEENDVGSQEGWEIEKIEHNRQRRSMAGEMQELCYKRGNEKQCKLSLGPQQGLDRR